MWYYYVLWCASADNGDTQSERDNEQGAISDVVCKEGQR